MEIMVDTLPDSEFVETPEIETTGEEEVIIDEGEESNEGESVDNVEVETTPDSAIQELQAQIKQTQQEVMRLAEENRNLRRGVEQPKSKQDEPLTRTQLKAILAEHKDDPEVLMNVVDYMMDQKAKEVVSTTDQRRVVNEKRVSANQIMEGIKESLPIEVYNQLPTMAANLGFDVDRDPFALVATAAIWQMGQSGKGAETRKSMEDTRVAEVKRKKGLDKTRGGGETGGKKQGVALTPDQIDMAKKLGVSPESYARFLPKS